MKTILAVILFLPLASEDPSRTQRPVLRPDVPPIGEAPRASQDDPHAEMRRVFSTVEKQLREIDRLLSDASAGGTSAGAANGKIAKAAQGMSDLIKGSQAGGQALVAGIDRILELANHPHPPGPG